MSASRRPAARRVDWLIQPSADTVVRLPMTSHVHVSGDGWTLTGTAVEPRPGLRVSINACATTQPMALNPARDSVDPRHVYLTIPLAGRASVCTLDGRTGWMDPRRALSYALAGPRMRFEVAAGARVTSVGVALTGDTVEDVLGDRVPPPLIPLVERHRDESLVVASPISPWARRVARDLTIAPFTGALRDRYFEGAAFQILAAQASLQADDRRGSRTSRPLSSRERTAVLDAHARLVGSLASPPSLGELARAAGLSDKRLNDGFRMLFGTTVFDTLRLSRLEDARRAIEAEDAPLKEIAARVGYAHVSSFILAFTRHFGEPPRRFTRRRSRS